MVTRLALRNFRNYPSLLVCPPPGMVVLTGENGTGKTNLLEAISLLSPGRGLRRAAIRDLDRDGSLPWHVSADLAGPLGPVRIETWRPPDLERRVAEVEGVAVRRQASLGEHASLAWLTPSQDRLLQDPPSARRRFLDRLVLTSAPEHGPRISAYERALRERSALLRGGGRDRVWLDVVERRMSEAGVAIAAARLETVAALNAQLERLETSFPRPILEVTGDSEGALSTIPAVEVEERMMAELRAGRAVDTVAGGASCGPHRSDLRLIDAETGASAQTCSTGRQKSLLVSVVLAQAMLSRDRLGSFPILLLDEISAHLDSRRRDALCVFLADLGIQAWLSGTDANAFRALAGRATFFHVNEGRLTAYD